MYDQLTLPLDFDMIIQTTTERKEMNHEHYWDKSDNEALVAACECGEELERVVC